jgi:hypothetical protein
MNTNVSMQVAVRVKSSSYDVRRLRDGQFTGGGGRVQVIGG